jgi:fibronectin-binding autotransporter adhesin
LEVKEALTVRQISAAAVLFLCFFSTAFAYDWSTNPGNGSAANPYQISTAEQLNSIGTNTTLLNKYFILMNDINMSAYTGTQYKIIGTGSTSTSSFAGTFDGNGFKISNLTYTTASKASNIGLFGSINNATIQNLRLENINISSQGDYVGGLAGTMNGGQIINCSVMGNIAGRSYVGGLVGSQLFSDGTITNCFCQGTVTGYSSVGGIIGEQSGVVSQTFNQSTVTGTGWGIGGIAGFQMYGSIKDCYNTGNVSGYYLVGGIMGRGIMQNCYSTGIITGQSDTGGLSGLDIGTVNSYWDIEASGIAFSGGGKGRTTEQMKQSANYISWNHEELVWTLAEGEDYPHLAWEGMLGDYLPPHYLTEYVPGYGEQWEPYRISSAEQLNAIGLFPDSWNKRFILENDIDLSDIAGTEFNKIGTGLCAFSGIFDGQGYTISNFTYNTTGSELFTGFFGYANNATIKNTRLRDIYVSSIGNGIGGLVGAMDGSTPSIENCSVTGSISGGSYVGGLIGGGAGTVKDCYSDCDITGKTVVGGLAGSAYGNISYCYSSGSITAVGDDVEELVGGQAGQMAGGLAGLQGDGTICVSFSNATVSGRSMLGGLVGAQAQRWEFTPNYAFISNCYAVGNVTGDDDGAYIGGLVGYQYIETGTAAIANCCSTGHVAGGNNSESLGGLIGYGGETVQNCFWDIQTSGMDYSAGGEGKSTAEMKTILTYMSAGWDFADIWSLCEGTNYPRLQWQVPAGDFACPDGVGVEDLDYFIGQWLKNNCTSNNNYCGGADLDESGKVDLGDYSIFAQHWLEM